MAKEWLVTIRLEDTAETRRNVALLTRHAFLKYGGSPAAMKKENMSEFLRFLIDYYHTMEVKRG